ncbi:recombinase family protein [Francisella sp. 19X1-34]|uniref:recombinase family protein n=1 Tax=Francisella sp. 19X1-34 TaxID=3087177 RepID=UPI002E306AB4|nr:recombinase family protein [Francisella sp. 19X1-34]MED7789268.1 recombinase family protein [Francisella sp. 19X1-34]
MDIVGYARVSTKDQSLDIQLNKLKSYGCTKIFQEKISGVDQNRPELIKCKEYLRTGDTLVITKIDRLARSTIDLGNIVNRLEKENINFVVLDQNIDTSTPTGKLTFHIISSVAEFENEIRKERQREGIQRALSKNKPYGRPRTITKNIVLNIKNHINNGLTTKEILDKSKISRNTFFLIKKGNYDYLLEDSQN